MLPLVLQNGDVALEGNAAGGDFCLDYYTVHNLSGEVSSEQLQKL